MQTLVNVACVPALLAGLLFVRGRHAAFKAAWLVVFGGFAVVRMAGLVAIAAREIMRPPLWDFKVFWMVGRICAAGNNIYDVASYRPFANILNPANDMEFNTIALKIGMPYPPPAVSLFCPLGHVANLQTAMLLWYSVVFIAIIASIIALWRQFLRAEGIAGLIVAAVLVIVLPGTTMTVGFGQLNFFALLLLVLVWREQIAWRAGAWLAPLLVLRPLTLLFAVYYLMRRQWSALLALALSSVLLFVLSVPLIGLNGLAAYVHQNPTQRYPEIYFRGWESLYKIMLSFSHSYDGYFSLSAHPLFVGICALLMAGAAYVCAVAAPDRRMMCLSMLLALGLFLYPNTGAHYSVLLLVPLLSIWRERKALGLRDATLIAFLSLQYLLLSFRDGTLTTGAVFGLDAFVFAAVALGASRRSLAMPAARVMQPA